MPNYTVIAESKTSSKVLGALNIIGGGLEVGFSVSASALSGGLTAPLLALTASHGVSTIINGVEMIWTGVPSPSLFEKAFTPYVGENIAFYTDFSLGLVSPGNVVIFRGVELYKKFGVFSPRIFPNTINDKIRNLFHCMSLNEIRATKGTHSYKYVITTDGELIIGRPKVSSILGINGRPQATDFLKHSDLASGAHVVGAGQATFTNGILQGRGAINSYSGHYMPWGNTKLVETVFRHHGFKEASNIYVDVAETAIFKGTKRTVALTDPLITRAVGQMYVSPLTALGKTHRFSDTSSPVMRSYTTLDSDVRLGEFNVFDIYDHTSISARAAAMAGAGMPSYEILQHLVPELASLSTGESYYKDYYEPAVKIVKANLIKEYAQQYAANLQKAAEVRANQLKFATVIHDMQHLHEFASFVGRFDPEFGKAFSALTNAAMGIFALATQAFSPLAIFGTVFGIFNSVTSLFGEEEDPNEDVKQMINALGNYIHESFVGVHDAMKAYSEHEILAMEYFYNATRDLNVRGFRQLAEQGQITYGNLKLLMSQSAHAHSMQASLWAKAIEDIAKTQALISSEGYIRTSGRAMGLAQRKVYNVQDIYKYIRDIIEFTQDYEHGAKSFWATEAVGAAPSWFKINTFLKKISREYSDKFSYTEPQPNILLILPLIENLAKIFQHTDELVLDFSSFMDLVDLHDALSQLRQCNEKIHEPILISAVFNGFEKKLTLLRDIVLKSLASENIKIDQAEIVESQKEEMDDKYAELQLFKEQEIAISSNYGDIGLAEVKEKYCQDIFMIDGGYYQCEQNNVWTCRWGSSKSDHGRVSRVIRHYINPWNYVLPQDIVIVDRITYSIIASYRGQTKIYEDMWRRGFDDYSLISPLSDYIEFKTRQCSDGMTMSHQAEKLSWFGNHSRIDMDVKLSIQDNTGIYQSENWSSYLSDLQANTIRTILAPHAKFESDYLQQQRKGIYQHRLDLESKITSRISPDILPAMLIYPTQPGYFILPSPPIDIDLLDGSYRRILQKRLAKIKLTYESTAEDIVIYVNLQFRASAEELKKIYKFSVKKRNLFYNDAEGIWWYIAGGRYAIEEHGELEKVKLPGDYNYDLVHKPKLADYPGLFETGFPLDITLIHVATNETQSWVASVIKEYEVQRDEQLRTLRHIFNLDLYQPVMNSFRDSSEMMRFILDSFPILSLGNSSSIHAFLHSGKYISALEQLEQMIKYEDGVVTSRLTSVFDDTVSMLGQIRQQIQVVHQLSQAHNTSSQDPRLNSAKKTINQFLSYFVTRVKVIGATEKFISPHLVEQYPSQVAICRKSEQPVACVQTEILKIIATGLGVVLEPEAKPTTFDSQPSQFAMQTYSCTVEVGDELVCIDRANNWVRRVTILRAVSLSWGDVELTSDRYNCTALQDGAVGRYCLGAKTEFIEKPLIDVESTSASANPLSTLGSAALYGAGCAALPEALGDLLHVYGYLNEQNASRVKFLANIILLGLSGSWLGTGTGMVTHKVLTCAGISDSKARVTANTVAFAVNTGGKINTMSVAATATSYLGGRFGLWAEKCLVSQLRDRTSSALVKRPC